jgi:ABC-type phosphate transport system permease subunit
LISVPGWAAFSPAVLLALYLTARRGWRITSATLLSAALLTATMAGADGLGLLPMSVATLTSSFFMAVIAGAVGAGAGTLLSFRLNRHA